MTANSSTLTGATPCHVCAGRGVPCCSPAPSPSVQWGYEEWLALGAYWMHISAGDRSRLSYGSALDAYDRARMKAQTADERMEADLGYLGAYRCSLAQSAAGRNHLNAAPVAGCDCPVCFRVAG